MKIKDNLDLSILEKYDFKKSKEWEKESGVDLWDPNNETYYFFEPGTEDDEDIVKLTEDNHAQGSIAVNSETRSIYIDLSPSCTYHVDNLDCPNLFKIFAKLVQDEIVEV